MKTRFNHRHCYVKTENGRLKYYAYYQGQSVTIEKELYDYLENDYSKKRHRKETERKHICASFDQIHDSIILACQCGKEFPALQVASAEEEFFERQQLEDRAKMIVLMKAEIEHLSPDEQDLILSFINGSSIIERLAKKYGTTTRAIYYRRRKLSDQLANKIREGFLNESFS